MHIGATRLSIPGRVCGRWVCRKKDRALCACLAQYGVVSLTCRRAFFQLSARREVCGPCDAMVATALFRLAIHRPYRSLRTWISSPYDCLAWRIPVMVEHHAGRIVFRKRDPAFCFFLSLSLRIQSRPVFDAPALGRRCVPEPGSRASRAGRSEIISRKKKKRPALRRPFLSQPS
jgi:hypothetical protein